MREPLRTNRNLIQTTLNGISKDIWDVIFIDLTRGEDFKAINALCRTNKMLANICKDPLFQDMIWEEACVRKDYKLRYDTQMSAKDQCQLFKSLTEEQRQRLRTLNESMKRVNQNIFSGYKDKLTLIAISIFEP